MKKRAKMDWKTLAGSIVVAVLILAGCTNSTGPEPPSLQDADIHLSQDATSLPSGSGEYVFDEVVLIDGDGRYFSEVDFTIENLGQQDLNISGIELSSGDIEDFDLIISGLSNVLGPSSSTSFSVRFDPLVSLGMRNAVVMITSNDKDEGIYTFTLKGIGMKKLNAGDNSAEDRFGVSVAISSDIMVAGAFCDDVGSNSGQGSAYVFYRNQGGPDNWGEVKKLIASDGESSEYFGSSVAIAGDIIVVGVRYDNISSNNNQGSAYVYYRN